MFYIFLVSEAVWVSLKKFVLETNEKSSFLD